ncbi:DUF885 domain-containing protein [Lacrimispora xylanolytica]|uniref:DUF885 domain-containing protein n=1 Tax=Lacrimispora xylanolytica TaxID=29375 RepID=A0ABY7AAX0_9FIRM|nr:DUF885 domain-containing protein [Lacrimispora xylanolytica]WAJ23827.1 DUF885 domain-containing protein [Lacrimispora xylanolytica]
MTNKFFKRGRWLISIFLVVSLLCSCTPPPKSAATPSGTGYEHYNAADVSMQKNFDLFTDDLFRNEISNSGISFHFTMADPASRGLKTVPLTLGDFSLDNMKKNSKDLAELKKKLNQFNPRKLTKDQRLTYQILYSYIDTEMASEGLELYTQPLTTTIGIQAQLPVLFAEYAFYKKDDVDHYLSLLSTIDDYYSQILEFEKQKSEAGLFMSDSAADHVLKSCEAYLIQPDHSFLSETFNTRIDALNDLTPEEKAAYKEKNLKVLEEHFVPAYKNLINGITALMGTGKNDKGLSWYPEGKKYFEYLVNSNTGTSYDSVDSLKKAIEKQITSDIKALGQITKENPKVLDQLDTYSFNVTKPEDILESLKSQIAKDFPELPKNQYTVKYVPKALESSLSPAFYLVPPIDRYEDNIIYINGNPRFQNDDLYTTLAHEGYPGHLYQNVYFLSKSPNDLRSILSFSSYSEGWATYVENYSYTLDNGLDPDLGKLLAHNSAVTLGIYAYLDICINYEGWDKEQTAKYLSTFYNVEKTDIVDSIYNSLVENPTNYMEYYVGYLEIMEMRNAAEKILKDKFNLKEFHTFLLDIGPAPFSVILPEFRNWLGKELRSS